jgi:sterol desaturase/sphingolipid hydroxylase (fatty acid hydroxylase superfamily)
MAQMPLYKNMPWNLDTSFFCLAASIGDAVMILIIYFITALLLKNPKWLGDLNNKKIIVSSVVGFGIALLFEKIALYYGLWSYSNLMPILPLGQIGISPILQMLILPFLVFYWVNKKLVFQK